MREYSSPLTVDVPATGNLTDDVVRNAAEAPDGVAFSRRRGDDWEDVTAAEFLDEVRAVAKGLVAAGHPGRRPGRPDLQDPLRVDPGRLRDLVRRRRHGAGLRDLLGRADRVDPERLRRPRRGRRGARPHRADRRAALRASSAQPRLVAGRTTRSRCCAGSARTSPTTTSRSGVRRRPRSTWPRSSTPPAPPAGPRAACSPTATSCSSSGWPCPSCTSCSSPTTPRPCCSCRWPTSSRGSSRSARSRPGSGSGTAPTSSTCSPTSTGSSRRSSSPCRGSSRRSSTPPRRRRPPRAAAASSNAPPTPRSPTRGPSTGAGRRSPLRARHALFSRLVYGTLRAALGGRCQYAVSGGAPLGDRLGHFYRGIGLVVLEGYGLTETTAALTANRPDALKIGTVGQPLPGTEVRVAEDGELLFRGGQVFAGYWEQRAGHRRGAARATAGSTPATSARSTRRASSGSPGARRRSW